MEEALRRAGTRSDPKQMPQRVTPRHLLVSL